LYSGVAAVDKGGWRIGVDVGFEVAPPCRVGCCVWRNMYLVLVWLMEDSIFETRAMQSADETIQ
jgi:hypothetical protein